MSAETSDKARTWADLLAITATMTALSNAMWGPLIFSTMRREYPQGDRGLSYTWLAFAVGGLLGLLALFVAQERPKPARVLMAIGGLMMAVAPFVYSRPDTLPSIASAVMGVAMLVAAPFIGGLPAPMHQEGGQARP